MSAIDPFTFHTTDGVERRFCLSLPGLKRVASKLGLSKTSEIFDADMTQSYPVILFEALVDKGELTEEQFGELIPAHLEDLNEIVGKLLGLKRKKAADPTSPTTAIQ